jgi:CBS domain-containing protein
MVENNFEKIAKNAKIASKKIAILSTDLKNKALQNIAKNLVDKQLEIFAANKKDLLEAKIMLEKGIGSVPVMRDGEMVGIVSKADFVTLAVGIAFDKIAVKEIMTKDVVSVAPTDRLVHARRQMMDANVGRLPVIDDEELVGMITSKDLMRAYIDFRKNVPEKYQKTQIKEIFVEDIMSSNPSYVSKEMSITEVSKIMMETGYNGLPVVEEGKVVGIITQTDILRLIEKLES